MTQNKTIICTSIMVFAYALTGCGQESGGPRPLAMPAVEAHSTPRNSNATVLGAIKNDDWYMVVSAPGSAKPLVIWSESKSTCERDVGEFSLKAVDPTSKAEPPKSWCMQGKEIRSRLGA